MQRVLRVTCSTLSAIVAASIAGCGGNSKAVAESEYPTSWNVAFKQAAALPTNYDFGRKTTVLATGSTYAPAAKALPCDITWDRDVPVTLRDGTVIYTDILRPAGVSDKLPSIVAWSPYGKSIPSAPASSVPPENFSGIAKFEGPDAAFWACRGYAVVNPDVRGALKSGGNIHYWGSVDANDGYDVIEWIAQQDWSNGKVGLHGTSWLAIAQWFIAATRPPHLAAIAPWNGLSDMYRNVMAIGGIVNPTFNSMVETGMTGNNKFESPSTMIGSYPLMNDYWNDKVAKVENITVPAYVTADGVTQLHRTGALDAFRRLGSSEKWLRINNTNEWYDQYTPKYQEDLALFFDRYLKGANNGWQNTPKVRIAVSDPGHTDVSDVPYADWPLPDTKYQRLYLDAATGAMNTKPVTATSKSSYESTTGQTTFKMTFAQDTQITGYLKARLWVEADGNTDMDLFLLVEKLAGDGSVLVPSPTFAAAYLPIPSPGAPGRLRVSLRALDSTLTTEYEPVHAFTTTQKLSAGQIVPVDIAIMPEAVIFHAGESIRLTIGGAPIKEQLPVSTLNTGTHVIHTGGPYESYLQIPVAPSVERPQ